MASRRHPNYRKMHRAIARWTEEAQGRWNGAALLDAKVTVLDGYLQKLGSAGDHVPAHLVGLQAIDLIEAADDLRRAADARRDYEAQRNAQVAA